VTGSYFETVRLLCLNLIGGSGPGAEAGGECEQAVGGHDEPLTPSTSIQG